MTKEPKLSAAVRIVPEWKDYDNEIKDLMDKWQQELKQNTSTRKFII
jgi:UDP-glucose:glycoprotein glucosyltransferase